MTANTFRAKALLRKKASATNNALFNAASNLNMEDMLAARRMAQIDQAEKQRLIRFLQGKIGDKAATVLGKLALAEKLPVLGTAALGSILGGTASNAIADSVTPGALVGGGAGLLTGAGINALGSALGNIEYMDSNELYNRLSNLSAADYLIPGRASKLRKQLYKEFLAHEDSKEKPQQHIF